MTKLETLLTFVVAPLAILLLIAGLSAAGSARKSRKRYRPGRAYTFAPVWFLAQHDPYAQATHTPSKHTPALPAGRSGRELVAGAARTGAPAGGTGGASDRW